MSPLLAYILGLLTVLAILLVGLILSRHSSTVKSGFESILCPTTDSQDEFI